MRQSHRLFLFTVSTGLLLLGAGCATTIPGVPTNQQSNQETSDSATPAKNDAQGKLVCSETDGGNVLAVKGTTVLKDGNSVVSTKVDYCGGTSKVFEYYCGNTGKSIESTGATCAENTSCVDGACVPVAARLAMINGACGPVNGQLSTNAPSVDLCSAGTPGPVTGNGPWGWTCAGINGGTTASCSAPKYLMSGLCGGAHNTTVSNAPTTNLCSRGTASSVMGQGPWTWTCTGEVGAEVASCRAQPKPLEVLDITNGACGSSHNATLISAPTTNLCVTGTVGPVTGEGPWAWTCAGSGGGTSANCTANVRIEP